MPCCASPTQASALLPPQTSATSRPRQGRRACSAPRSRAIPTRRRRATHRPGLQRQAVERGPRLHGPRPVRVHATRPGCRWDGPGQSVWSPKPLTYRARPSTSSARPIPPSSPTSRSTRPDCWRGRFRSRRAKRPSPEHHLRTTRRVALPNDPARSAKLFSDTGTDLVAMAKTNVYQTKDSASAAKSVDGFYAELQPTSQPAKAVNNLPDSRCLQLEDQAFYCWAPRTSYAIEEHPASLLDAQQRSRPSTPCCELGEHSPQHQLAELRRRRPSSTSRRATGHSTASR